MPCYRPLRGYRAPHPNASGKFPYVFDRTAAAVIPCGRCIGCRIDRSRMWALRCVHEASLYENNCFITLTYDDDHLPNFGVLKKSDLQRFFKRLRKRYGPGIRFYGCGEYGEQLGRPHFHVCIFNHDFVDRTLWQVRNGVRLYISNDLATLWPFGFSSLGDVTFESAAYVARYIMKKISGSPAEAHYTRLVPETGELVSIPPEFTVMSRRPGIGKQWFDKFSSDVFPGGFIVSKGVKCKPPRYYDSQFELVNPELMAIVKARRVKRATERRADSTPDRLKVREKVANSRLTKLVRDLS